MENCWLSTRRRVQTLVLAKLNSSNSNDSTLSFFSINFLKVQMIQESIKLFNLPLKQLFEILRNGNVFFMDGKNKFPKIFIFVGNDNRKWKRGKVDK